MSSRIHIPAKAEIGVTDQGKLDNHFASPFEDSNGLTTAILLIYFPDVYSSSRVPSKASKAVSGL